MKKIIFSIVFVFSAISGISGCSSSDSTTAATTLTGTAATGAPIDGTVFVKDAKGAEKSVATAINGSFTLEVSGMTPPYLLKVVPASGPALYSFANQNGQTVNLTPTTNLAMFLAYAKADLNSLYNGWDGTGISSAQVDSAEAIVRANLEAQITANGVDAASFNLFTSAFSANGSGIDGVLDNLRITLNIGAGSFTFTDVASNNLGFNEAITPMAPPAPASAISIVTVSGGTHTLNGVYRTACYDQGAGEGRIDLVTISGTAWVNSSLVFAGSVTCSGSPTSIGAVTAVISKGSQIQTNGWVNGPGGPPTRADGNGLLSNTETVTTFAINVINVSDPDNIYGGFTVPAAPIPAYYIYDDTGTGFAMYRDKDGSIASASDPYIRR